MSYAFRCTETGLVEWADCAGVQPCPFCNGQHMTYECGLPRVVSKDSQQEPAKEKTVFGKPAINGIQSPYIRGDRISKYYDWSCGSEIDSKSQRKRKYAEKGLVEKSEREHRRQHNEPDYKQVAVSYPGQSDHTSSSERHAVRTKTGQKVI